MVLDALRPLAPTWRPGQRGAAGPTRVLDRLVHLAGGQPGPVCDALPAATAWATLGAAPPEAGSTNLPGRLVRAPRGRTPTLWAAPRPPTPWAAPGTTGT